MRSSKFVCINNLYSSEVKIIVPRIEKVFRDMNEKYTEHYFETKKNFHLTILRQGICGE